MSYIENLTGSVVNASVQESLALGAGNFKIKGFDLTTSVNYKVLSSGLAIIDGLRVISTGNLQILGSSTLNKYVFLRIQTYIQLENGITVRKANLSLIAQTSSTPANNDDLYENITGTKDVLLAYVNNSGVVDLTTNGTLGVYDVPTRLTSVETKNTEQDTRLTTLEADAGWLNIPAATGFTSAANYRKIKNIVYLKGQINKNTGNIAASDAPFTLPVNYRPLDLYNALVAGNTNFYAKLQINTNGTTVIATPGGTASTYIRLDNLFFMVD